MEKFIERYGADVGTYAIEAIWFINMLEKRLNVLGDKTIHTTRTTLNRWVYYKKKLKDRVRNNQEFYSKDSLIVYLHRLGDISEKYKESEGLRLSDFTYDDNGEISNDEFLKRIDRLKTLAYELIELQIDKER